MTHLLDVNFLVALFDPWHVNHEAAHYWFSTEFASGWATCSITEAGCSRVLSHSAYPTVSTTPTDVLKRLSQFCDAGGHSFWTDDVSLRVALDDEVADRLQGHRQVTDFHLAALASRHGGRLATFDGRLRRTLAGTTLASTVRLVE
ncbi:MAG: PIN domain-containing protein [Acidobacteria bacterium]|nr:PIN domain-containing protein [Acidobacteriota bacterium]